jgi:L-ascorbate 6-phosphate lactonase
MIMPINGAFGNLDSTEAAVLVNHIKPKLAIPCHFWNFIEHLSNPIEFSNKMKLYNPDVNFIFMRPGEELELIQDHE